MLSVDDLERNNAVRKTTTTSAKKYKTRVVPKKTTVLREAPRRSRRNSVVAMDTAVPAKITLEKARAPKSPTITAMTMSVSSTLVHHGVASSSSPHNLLWVIDDTYSPNRELLLYSSHCVINVAVPAKDAVSDRRDAGTPPWQERVMTVVATLRTATSPRFFKGTSSGASGTAGGGGDGPVSSRVITAIKQLKQVGRFSSGDAPTKMLLFVSTFSDGTVTIWKYESNQWNEVAILVGQASMLESVTAVGEDDESVPLVSNTDVDGCYHVASSSLQITVATASSMGVMLHRGSLASVWTRSSCQALGSYAAASVTMQPWRGEHYSSPKILIATGTASPRSNRIHLYTVQFEEPSSETTARHHGYLTGHMDWITCLAFTDVDQTFVLASGSRDARIRLWKFQRSITPQDEPTTGTDQSQQNDLDNDRDSEGNDDDAYREADDAFDDDEARLCIRHPYVDDDGTTRQSSTPVTLEALLFAHEETVTAVSWRPDPNGGPLTLLSSSMDRTILLWKEDMAEESTASGTSGVWIPTARVGSAGGILGGSVGASLLGFVDATFSPSSGTRIAAHGYGGSLHFWTLSQGERWVADPCLTGHFRGVSDLSWEAVDGRYLLSVGLDQTCRLWAPLSKNNDLWHEVARPQVHGYDLTAITCIGDGVSELSHRFVSGADEKELRVFDAPLETLRLLKRIDTLKAAHDTGAATEAAAAKGSGETTSLRVERAYLPSLGLSNRATATDSLEVDDDEGYGGDRDGKDTPNVASFLPHEHDLGATTLWPEVRKLFGHNTELVCLASSRTKKGVILASACKARDVENAVIRLWDVDKNTCTQVLQGGHRSTVAALQFSGEGTYLASSGKDRRLCLWKRVDASFQLVAAVDSAHKRIVWSVDFIPNGQRYLSTGSRDGFVKVWRVSTGQAGEKEELVEASRFEPCCKMGKQAEAVTAIAFAPSSPCKDSDETNVYLLAVGMENGLIELWTLTEASSTDVRCEIAHRISTAHCHIDRVKKLVWRPHQEDGTLTLASCGMDHGVRIHKVGR